MKKLLPVLALVLLLAGCRKQPRYATFNGFAQGTVYTIVVRDPSPELGEKIDALFDEIDLTFSVFNPASLTSRINRGETTAVTPLFEECFALAKQIHTLTGGRFDSTVAPLVDAWGFGAGEAEAEPDIASIMEYVGMDKVRIEGGRIIKDDARVQLDFGSIAKGFTVDRLAELIEGEGTTDYMVEVGGEVRARGLSAAGRAWRIGIDKPVFGLTRRRETVVSLGGNGGSDLGDTFTSIATSGNYRNWFVDEAGRTRVHIIDPQTGMPSRGEILSVSIVAAECAVADAWATGIMVCGTLDGARHLLESTPDAIEYYIIYGTADPEIATTSFHSPDFPLDKN